MLLTHGLLPHCGSMNGSVVRRPRLALIARWNDPDYMGRPAIAQTHCEVRSTFLRRLKALADDGAGCWQDRVDTDLWGVYYRAQPCGEGEEKAAQALGWDRVTDEMRRDDKRYTEAAAQGWAASSARL